MHCAIGLLLAGPLAKFNAVSRQRLHSQQKFILLSVSVGDNIIYTIQHVALKQREIDNTFEIVFVIVCHSCLTHGSR
jgi:hypothetical protein